ncbi:MAG TPA: hypothetical protein VIK86_07780 [Candidatus Paceibacterota bacterium]
MKNTDINIEELNNYVHVFEIAVDIKTLKGARKINAICNPYKNKITYQAYVDGGIYDCDTLQEAIDKYNASMYN